MKMRMMRAILIPAILIGMASVFASTPARRQPPNCLPDGMRATDVVSAEVARPGEPARKVLVRDKLKALGARCRRGKLVDARGREIRFFRLQGCWGNPPPDYLEILERQRKELETLKKRYTVIEMTCNPSGDLTV